MVTQDTDTAVTQAFDEPEYFKRLGTAINQVTSQPDLIRCWIKFDLIQHLVQFVITALDITNREDSHENNGLATAVKRFWPEHGCLITFSKVIKRR